MFVQRHYEAIAELIRHSDAVWGNNPTAHKVLRDHAISLCKYFREGNSRFNYAKFMKACFPNDKPEGSQ